MGASHRTGEVYHILLAPNLCVY